MSKITLTNVGTLIDATTAQNTINANNAIIQAAFDNTLSRDNTSPNTYTGSTLDMNSKQIINLPAPSTVNSPARVIDVVTNPTITIPGTGTSGHNVPYLDGNNTWSGTNTYSNTVTLSGTTTHSGTATAVTQTIKDNTTKLATTAYVDASYRKRLDADATYYVRKDGSDSNTGLADTAGGAFLTIQKAVNVVSAIDTNGFNVLIQVRDGTYTENITLGPYLGRGYQGHVSPTAIVIQGNTSTPGNVVVSGSFTAVETSGFEWVIRKLRINGGSANAVYSDLGSWISIDGVEFGTTSSNHMVCSGGIIEIVGNYTILGNAFAHYFVIGGGKIVGAAFTVTLTGTPVFTYFVYAESQGLIVLPTSFTFSGAATGSRFFFNQDVAVQYSGGVPLTIANLNSLLPGNATGTIINQTFGTQTNDAASAGNIGELFSASVALASAVSLTTATPANVTSMSLTAGDWDVSANLYFNPAGTTTVTALIACISQTSATLDTTTLGAINQYRCASFTPAADVNLIVSPLRISLAATTTIYLVGQSTFATSTNKGYGILRARRVR